MNSVWATLLGVSAAIDSLNRRMGRAMVLPILIAVLVSAANALSRKFFDLSSNAWLEVQWYLYALSFLGAAGYVLLVNEHVRIDAVSQYLSARTRAGIDLALMLVVVLPMTLMFGEMGFELFWKAWETGEMSYNAGGLTRWPAYACIPLGMALLGLQALSEAIRRAAFLAGKVDAPTLSEDDLPAFLPEQKEVQA
jgi:TRAP-type mannitol/chloroaromatic compound transport system permease small subunit